MNLPARPELSVDPGEALSDAHALLAVLVEQAGGRVEIPAELWYRAKYEDGEFVLFQHQKPTEQVIVLEVRRSSAQAPAAAKPDEGVVDAEIVDDAPPTFHHEPHPELPGVVRPVLDQAMRMDPATGAVEWGN